MDNHGEDAIPSLASEQSKKKPWKTPVMQTISTMRTENAGNAPKDSYYSPNLVS